MRWAAAQGGGSGSGSGRPSRRRRPLRLASPLQHEVCDLYHRQKLLGRRRGLASRVRAHEVPLVAPAEGVFSPFLVLPQQPYDEKLHGGAINGCSGAPNACRQSEVYFAYTRCGRNRRCCRHNSARSKREFQLLWAPCSRNMANPRATPGGRSCRHCCRRRLQWPLCRRYSEHMCVLDIVVWMWCVSHAGIPATPQCLVQSHSVRSHTAMARPPRPALTGWPPPAASPETLAAAAGRPPAARG